MNCIHNIQDTGKNYVCHNCNQEWTYPEWAKLMDEPEKLNINNVVVCRCGNRHILGVICICRLQENMKFQKDEFKDIVALTDSEYFNEIKNVTMNRSPSMLNEQLSASKAQPKPYTTEINIMFDCFDYDLLSKASKLNDGSKTNQFETSPYSENWGD